MDIKTTTMASDTLPQFEQHPTQPDEPYPSALALAGMSIFIVEDEPLIAMSVESGLQDAGAAVVKIAASISAAHSVIDAENSFDAAVVDLHVADGDASSLIGVLSERGIPAVVTTGSIIEEQRLGKLSREMRKLLDRLARGGAELPCHLKVGTVMVREHQGTLQR